MRAQLLSDVRDFFNQRGYMEVETPILAQHGVTDVYLSNMQTQVRGTPYYLQTSPEYHMKRLLATDSGPIFQLARVFRDDELGRWHNPEFTLLEWYQLHVDHHAMMLEVDELLQTLFQWPAMKRLTYQQAFLEHCGLNPHTASVAQLKDTLVSFDLHGVLPNDEQDVQQYLFLLMSHVVEPSLARQDSPVAIYHFPVQQAALARIKNGVAERFEVYYRGVELANGFHELTDANLQLERFEEDNRKRKERQLPVNEPDDYLLQALQHGLPPCSGVALGIERLLALALQYDNIATVMAFDGSRA